MAYTAAQINSIFQAVLQRPADTYAIMTFANSSQSDASVRTQIETSYEASVNVNPVVRLYEGAFGRVPDTAGLQANYATYINGYNITQLAQNFLNSSEGVAKFGSNVTVSAGFISTIYTQALNRSAGSSEISYWLGTGKSAAQVLAEISNSTEAVNKEAAPIVTYLDSAAVAALGGGSANTGTLYNQTSSSSTSTSNPGSTFTFTSLNGDNLPGTSGNDTFTGTGAALNAGTIQTGDVVNGNGGQDTVVFTASTGAVSLPTFNGISIVNFSNNQGAVTADLSATTVSVVTVQNEATVLGDTITLKSGQVAGLDNVKTNGAAAVETFKFSAATASLAVANGTNLTTQVDLQTATANGTVNILSVGSAANTISNVTDSTNSVQTVNISGTQALTIGLNTGFGANVKTIDATANSGGVKLTATVAETALTSAKFGSGNDSFLTGDSFATAGNAALTATIDGGAGLNYLGVNNGSLANLLAATNKVSNFQVLEIQNAFDSSKAGAAQTFDLSKLAGVSSIQFDGAVTVAAGNGSQTYNNLQAGGSIAFNGNVASGTNTDLTFNLASGQTNATETVFLQANTGAVAGAGGNGAAHTINAFQIQNVSTLNLNVRDIAGADSAGLTTFTGINDSSLTTINLQSTATDSTGAATKAAALILGGGFTTTALTSVDASGYGANVDASGLAGNLSTAGATIKGGAGELYAVGGTGNDTITAGAGGGIFNGGAGTDTITLSAATTANVALTQGGATTKVLDVVNNVAGQNITSSGADSITGFHLGSSAATSDVLAFNGTAAGGITAATFTSAGAPAVANAVNASSAGQSAGVTVTINASGIATVSGATGTAAVDAVQKYLNSGTGFAAGATAAYIDSTTSSTYVVHTGADNTTATDSIVKLVGITSETAISTTVYNSSTIHIA